MFGQLAVFYLFLGGTGAGAIGACALADLLLVRRPFGFAAPTAAPSAAPDARILAGGFAAGLVLLAVGIACLILDLGRADRVMGLFLHPTFSVMSIGAYVLLFLLIVGIFLVLSSLLYIPELPRSLIMSTEIAAVVLAVAAMAYTGLLLATTKGVALWWSPFVPLLFVLSSSSGGIAVMLIAGAFVEDAPRAPALRRHLVRADAAIIALEILCAIGFMWESLRDANPGTAAGIAALLHGEAATAWWLGFCLFGMAVPLVGEAVSAGTGRHPRGALALAAVSVLVGAFCLRWAIVDAGVLREPVLEEPGLEYPFWN